MWQLSKTARIAPQGNLSMHNVRLFRRIPVAGRPPEVLDAEEAARYLQVSRESLLRGAKTGRFPGEQHIRGGLWHFQRKDLDTFAAKGIVICSLFREADYAEAEDRRADYVRAELAKRSGRKQVISVPISKPTRSSTSAPLKPAPPTATALDQPEPFTKGHDLPPVMTPADVAAYLQVSTQTVTKMVERGELAGRQIGTRWNFTREAVMALFHKPSRPIGHRHRNPLSANLPSYGEDTPGRKAPLHQD